MTIKIDKNVPLPPHIREGRAPEYPWRTMEIGDSFFVAEPKTPNAATASRQTGRTFTRRAVVEDGVKGFRVWRIA